MNSVQMRNSPNTILQTGLQARSRTIYIKVLTLSHIFQGEEAVSNILLLVSGCVLRAPNVHEENGHNSRNMYIR